MTQGEEQKVLFPEEIIPWDEVINLETVLRIPFRYKAKGIECITGMRGSYQPSPGVPIVWFPFVLKNFLGFFKKHLHELPTLECPVPPEIANDFIEKFIMLKDSPNMVPSFLTIMDLKFDQEQRREMFKMEKSNLQQRVSEGGVFLVDKLRNRCKQLMNDVYFSRSEAIKYLDEKGLSDRAFSAGCSWLEQIRMPEVEEVPLITKEMHYGFPQELITMGVEEYRKILTLRKSELVASQLAQLLPKSVRGEHVIDEDSGEINAPAPMTEPASGLIESEPNLAVDVAPPVQASSPSANGNNNVKFSSSKHPVVSENDEAKYLKINPVTESELTMLIESVPDVKRLIGSADVMDRLSISRATLYNYTTPGSPSFKPNFPQSVKLGEENRWDEAEINAFMEALNLKKKRKTK